MKKMDLTAPLRIVRLSAEKTSGLSIPPEKGAIEETLAKYMKKDACLLFRQLHRIVWGRLRAGALELADGSALDAALVEEVRAFNEGEELLLAKKRGKLCGRYISDNDGEGAEAVDSAAPLWGERTKSENGWTHLEDAGRGLSLTVPAEGETKRFALVTRSYIGYDSETQQAGYEDMRCKAIVPLEEG